MDSSHDVNIGKGKEKECDIPTDILYFDINTGIQSQEMVQLIWLNDATRSGMQLNLSFESQDFIIQNLASSSKQNPDEGDDILHDNIWLELYGWYLCNK